MVNLTMSNTDIAKIFARTEGDLLEDEYRHVIYSTRKMLTNLYVQLPNDLKTDIKTRYPKTIKKIGF